MLYLIRGVPGSGKTTKAKELLQQRSIDVYFEADMYFGEPYQFESSKLPKAHEWCLAKTKEALELGYNVAVSNTFIKVWELKKYMQLGFPFGIIECKGNYVNTHGVPAAKVNLMKSNYEEL
jgi:tRNA uridine 5-carbamoylmethylation protein Kti12